MSVDVGVEGLPGGGGKGAEVALVDQTLLVRGEVELELLTLRLILKVSIHGVPIRDNTRGAGLGLSVVKNAVIEDLECRYFILHSKLDL